MIDLHQPSEPASTLLHHGVLPTSSQSPERKNDVEVQSARGIGLAISWIGQQLENPHAQLLSLSSKEIERTVNGS